MTSGGRVVDEWWMSGVGFCRRRTDAGCSRLGWWRDGGPAPSAKPNGSFAGGRRGVVWSPGPNLRAALRLSGNACNDYAAGGAWSCSRRRPGCCSAESLQASLLAGWNSSTVTQLAGNGAEDEETGLSSGTLSPNRLYLEARRQASSLDVLLGRPKRAPRADTRIITAGRRLCRHATALAAVGE